MSETFELLAFIDFWKIGEEIETNYFLTACEKF